MGLSIALISYTYSQWLELVAFSGRSYLASTIAAFVYAASAANLSSL